MPRIRRQVGSFLDSVQKSAIVKITDSAPTTAWNNFNLGDVIVDKTNLIAYMLMAKPAGVANWKEVSIDIDTDSTLSAAVDTKVPSALACKTYADNLAIAGSPDATTGGRGIIELATDVEAKAVTDTVRAIVPANLAAVFAEPPAIGSTAAAAGSFTDLDAVATGTISLNSDVASDFTVTGATEDLTLESSAGRVIVNGEEATDAAVHLLSAAGGITVDSALALILTSAENTADSILIESTAGGVDILASGAAAGEDIDIVATGSSVNISSSENVADSITITSSAGGIDLTAAGAAGEDIDITNTAGSVNITAGENAGDSIVIQSSIGGIQINAAGAAAGEDISITATGSSINLTSTEADAGAITLTASNAAGAITHTGRCVYTPDAITATSAGVAASVATVVTEITTNGDSDLDNVTLAAGVDGQVKIFAVVVVGNASDSVKITPASMIGGTQITFAANPLGLGCQMVYDAGAAGWICTGNNGGTVA